ncbi:undecaprenyl-diphosphooligosaccharide--protein glycotransferase [Sulfurovum sp. TSL1]|nr:undecaprenyl-diphosphooligosaccharide--protein glycotransferase [Sulfurovum sp. TSL1]
MKKVSSKQLFLMMFFAYIFSFTMRMIWVWQLQDNPNFYWNDQLMINTNDGYTWAAGAQNILYGMHEYNSGIRDMWANGIIFFTVLFTKVTPFSLETIILYMPAMISSLVVIPIILISRLYGEAIWGFFAALLGAIAWSYYNRTMIGYYDTDMFSAMAPMFILYFLMKSTMDFTPRSALYAAIAIALYPFLYDAGKSIVYAMGIIYALYMMFYHRHDRTTYISMVLVFVALVPFPLVAPFNYLIKIVVLIGLYFVLKRSSVEQKKLMFISAILFLLFMYFGNVFGLILGKVMSYVSTGTAKEGLHFYGVHQTIREAGKIPFETFANRISGSQIGVIVSFIGYIVLVVRHKAFILALPLIGIGAFALWGGLRFTVYAVPIAAMSAIYLFHIITTTISDKKSIYVVGMTLLTGSMLYPNITHIIEYKVPTVFNKAEVEDLVKLDAISKPKDYTLTWWDYGYPIWFYSSTNTIIDGGKHQNDNFIISKIMQTSSSDLAANLSRLAVETYVESNYANIANTIFKNRQEDQLDPNLLLSELASGTYTLPKKTRDIYLYLPYRMMRIFPTVAVFGNLDLTTGQEERKVAFYPTQAVSNKEGTIAFNNGIMFDTKKGVVRLGNKEVAVKYFVVTQHTKEGKLQKQSQVYHADGEYVVVYMQSYGQFVIMDKETFNSMYVQMFMLETYDKDLFELVVSSPYSKIYKLKI